MALLSSHRWFQCPWFRVFGLSQAPAASTHHRLAYSQFPMSFFSIHVHFRFFCCPACNLVSLVFHCSIYHFIFCFKWTTDCYFFDGTIAIFIVSSLFISDKITLFTWKAYISEMLRLTPRCDIISHAIDWVVIWTYMH